MSESKKYLCEAEDNVTRFEVIGLSIMAYLDTHVKHDNRSVCRGVSLKDAREWIREQIKRNTPSEDLDGEISQFIDKMDLENNGRWSEEDIIACAEHFANWQKEQMEKQANAALGSVTLADMVAYNKGVAEGRRMEKEETNESVQVALDYANKCYDQSMEDKDIEKAYYWDGWRDCLTAFTRRYKEN